MNTKKSRIRAREKDTIIQALSAGVVPSQGIQHIQVGRSREVKALIDDFDRVADGGGAFRVIVGSYGSGKTFFLSLAQAIALEKRLVATRVDLAPDRRIHASGGQARALYSEIVRNLCTRSKPGGGALRSILERFLTDCLTEAERDQRAIDRVVREKLRPLQSLTFGPAFVDVLEKYVLAEEAKDDVVKDAALRWLQGEYRTLTEVRKGLGVAEIIDDQRLYDSLRILAQFFVIVGYGGLFVAFDEMVNLYKLQSAAARKNNYEQILRMLNDVLQGGDSSLAIVLGGTPEFLIDPRRGLYSYEALESRIAENRFATDGLVDLSGPVLRLPSLTPEELYLLLDNIRNVFALGDEDNHLVPDDALMAFLEFCNKQIGEAYFRTPRNSIKAFVQLLSVLEQNPQTTWEEHLGKVSIGDESALAQRDTETDTVADDAGSQPDDDDDDLVSFRL